ncbi:MAG: hypothetical protein CMJ80_02670 [Planctomycetaceae bacterium]|nr:hypothetical protein [Planctomycetaceae bacterium]
MPPTDASLTDISNFHHHLNTGYHPVPKAAFVASDLHDRLAGYRYSRATQIERSTEMHPSL